MTKTDYVQWLSQVISAARTAGVRQVDMTTPAGRVRFAFPSRSGAVRAQVDIRQPMPAGYGEQIQLAEWLNEGRLCVVRSPGVGVWRSAVASDSTVAEGDKLGEIRSVGVTVSVRSPTRGAVVANYLDDGQPVQYGQLLLSVLRV